MAEHRCLVVGPPPEAGGGIAAVTAALARASTPHERGWQVDVLDSGGGRGTSGYRAFPTAVRTLAVTDAQLVHLQVASKGSTLRKLVLAEIARWRGTPYVIHLHGGGYEDFLLGVGSWRRDIIRRFFQGAREVIVLGDVWRELLVRELGLPSGLITVVDNGVPGVQMAPKPDKRIIFVGGVTHDKGVDVLLAAARTALVDHPDWRLDLVGPTPEPALVDAARALASSTGDRVTVHGLLDVAARDRLYASASVFVLPSRAEGLPLVMLEAMSAQLVPVVTDLGAVREVIEDDVNGIVVPPGDVTALQQALSSLITDPGRRSVMAQQAFETWQERFQVAQMVDGIVDVWGRAVGRAEDLVLPDAPPVVSVVIPTLGRRSLRCAVDSALTQGVPIDLVIVNDSGQELTIDLPATACVVETSGRCGAAAARNLGMQHARGDMVAFLDDDDVWLPGHLVDALQTLARRPDADIYASCGTVVRPDGSERVEPVELLSERSVASYFFGPTAWFSRCRRLMTPTLVFRRSLADLMMDTGLSAGEDTWWLLSAQHDRRAAVVQSAHVGVRVNAAPSRDVDRRAERDDAGWIVRLESVAPGAGAGYLAELGRDRCRKGDLGGVSALVPPLLRQPDGRAWLPVLAAQTGVAVGIRTLHVFRRRGA